MIDRAEDVVGTIGTSYLTSIFWVLSIIASVKCRVRELERKAKDFKKYPEKYDFIPKDIIGILPIEEEEPEPKFEHADEYFITNEDNTNDFDDLLNEKI